MGSVFINVVLVMTASMGSVFINVVDGYVVKNLAVAQMIPVDVQKQHVAAVLYAIVVKFAVVVTVRRVRMVVVVPSVV